MEFDSPWSFALVIIIPVVLIVRRRFRLRPAVTFSSVALARIAGSSFKKRFIFLPGLLRISAAVCLIIVIARPRLGTEKIKQTSEGIAIQMVVDRSGSMSEEMDFGGAKLNRLEVVKKVFHEFVSGNEDELEGRPNDLIGMITFGTYADTACPLTLAHGALKAFLDQVKLPVRESESRTAIGDAIALAAARLKTAEDSRTNTGSDAPAGYKIRSKIMILLTDGRNTAGKRQPLEAAALARDWGITIYTIGIGGDESVRRVQGLMGTIFSQGGSPVDETTLKSIAEATGGIFRMADSADGLREVYREIGELEKSKIEADRYRDYSERFLPFLIAAMALLGLEVLLQATVFRRVP